MLRSELPEMSEEVRAQAKPHPGGEGLVIEGFNPATIVRLKDGSLITEAGQQSTDGGRTWRSSKRFVSPGATGLIRLPNGDLGAVQGSWTLADALGNGTNNWYFRWLSDEGRSWSDPVQITLPGLTMGLPGTCFALRDGKRIILTTYSQFLGSRFDRRGGSWGSYRGVRVQTETEGHFPLNEVCRVYYSDDNGRTWAPCDGWIMGWRDQRWSDAFTEGDGVELGDGRILVVGRTLTGRVYQAISDDRGHSWWPGAQPMDLAASYSPARIRRFPQTGHLLIIWNQVSRMEIRKGFRRSRLSSAISKDEGRIWEHFKNIEAIKSLAGVTRVPPEDDLTPVWGDDEVGELPDDFAIFHYPNVSIIGDEVFLSYSTGQYTLTRDEQGALNVETTGGSRMRILPVEWFYS